MWTDPLDREAPRPVRAVAFVALLACMVLPPFANQVLGVESHWLRPWRMFHRTAEGIVVAEFRERRPDGREVPLDRSALLGEEPRSARESRLVGMRATWEEARRLCARLGPGADVRVSSRVATLQGWKSGYTGRENLCTSGPPAKGDGR